MNNLKKIYIAYLLPSLVQVMIAAIIAGILDSKGIELGYTSPVGLFHDIPEIMLILS